MGKGDLKTRRGKIARGTYGVRRRKKKNPAYVPPVVEPKKKVAEAKEDAPAKKPAAKKSTAKKPAAKKSTAKKTPAKKAAAEKKED